VPRKDDAEEQAREIFAETAPRAKTAARSLHAAPSAAPSTLSALQAGDLSKIGGPRFEDLGTPALAAETEEAATQILYRFPSSVTLASGATMMIPFVDREITASRTYLYQPETNPHRPLAAVRLRNDGDSALPAGLVTAFETGGDGASNFAGDAQLPLLPRGATRFITFALDSRTAIRREDQGTRRIQLGKASKGELTRTVKSVWTIDYEITPPAEEDREVIVEEARLDGWKATGDSRAIEETPTRLRYTVTAPRGRTAKATLIREHLDYESIALTSLAPDAILAAINGLENQTPELKEAISKLGALTGEIGKARVHKRELDAERQKIAGDQDRIRKNLASTGSSSDLGRRYLDTLRSEEDRLVAIAAEEKAADEQIAAKTKAAEDVAQGLVL